MRSYTYNYSKYKYDFYIIAETDISSRIFSLYFPIYVLHTKFKLMDDPVAKRQAETHKKFDTLIKKLK